MLAINVNILDLFGLNSIVCLYDGLCLGGGYVKLENKSVLPGSHIAYFLVGVGFSLGLEIIENNVFYLRVTEAAKDLLFAVYLQKMIDLVKGEVCAFEFSLVENGHHIAVVKKKKGKIVFSSHRIFLSLS